MYLIILAYKCNMVGRHVAKRLGTVLFYVGCGWYIVIRSSARGMEIQICTIHLTLPCPPPPQTPKSFTPPSVSLCSVAPTRCRLRPFSFPSAERIPS